MVPLKLTYLHCLQHFLFEHLFNLYYTHMLIGLTFCPVSLGVILVEACAALQVCEAVSFDQICNLWLQHLTQLSRWRIKWQ